MVPHQLRFAIGVAKRHDMLMEFSAVLEEEGADHVKLAPSEFAYRERLSFGFYF